MNERKQEIRQKMRDPNVTSLYFATLLRFTPPRKGFPCKILRGGQGMAKVQNGEEILTKVSTLPVERTNITDERRICDSKDPNVM